MFEGVLFFPVTPFAPDDSVNIPNLAEHVRRGVEAGAGAVFVACGTGEFHAFGPREFASVVRTAVEVVGGRVPVFAGAGGVLPITREYARSAQEAGADGLLLMPPYLAQGPAAGLVAYVRQVASATDLPLIVYQRGTARFDIASALAVARMPQVIGFKDGVGDLAQLSAIVAAVRADGNTGGERFQLFNGMPTAEAFVLAYRAIGVDLYSSAVLCFAPDVSLAFHRAVTSGDDAAVDRLTTGFVRPLTALHWGGLRRSTLLAGICETFGLGLSMHSNSHLGISLAAMVHLGAATPRLTYACDTHWPWKTEDVVAPGSLTFTDGAVALPPGPGLGVELDRDELARLHEQYLRCGLRNRDDTGYMQSVDPSYRRASPRW